MFVLNKEKDTLVNLESVREVKRETISVSAFAEDKVILLGKYSSTEEAEVAFLDLMKKLERGECLYRMGESYNVDEVEILNFDEVNLDAGSLEDEPPFK